MDGNFSDKLKTVLSDPDAMATITKLAKNFSQSTSGAENAQEVSSESALTADKKPLEEMMEQPAIAAALKLLGDGSRERMALLQAMRPFVKQEKKEKLDRIIQTMKMLDLLVSTQKLI